MKRFFLFLAIAMVLGAMGVALAQTDDLANTPPSPTALDPLTVSGKVVSSSPTSVVISTDDGQQMTFTVDSSTSMPTVKAGDRITVDYRTTDGVYNASRVIVVPLTNTLDTTPPRTTTTPTYTEKTPAYNEDRTLTQDNRQMPRTAGFLPLIALMGAALVGSGLMFRAVSRFAS